MDVGFGGEWLVAGQRVGQHEAAAQHAVGRFLARRQMQAVRCIQLQTADSPPLFLVQIAIKGSGIDCRGEIPSREFLDRPAPGGPAADEPGDSDDHADEHDPREDGNDPRDGQFPPAAGLPDIVHAGEGLEA